MCSCRRSAGCWRSSRTYLAGRDEDRLDDLNAALRDAQIRAVVCIRGGCGSLRLARGVDVDALRANPKPLVGFSDCTALLQVWHQAGVTSLHGAIYGDHAGTVRDLLFGGTPAPLLANASDFGAELTIPGTATGILFGGNLEMLARAVGVLPFDLRGHILLLEIFRDGGLTMVDRALTQLIMSGSLDGITAVALGGLTGFEDHSDRGWTIVDLLRERLGVLDVPVLAGLQVGHLDHPVTVPLGTECVLDTATRTLSCSAALR